MMNRFAKNVLAGIAVLFGAHAALAQKARWVETHSWSGVGSKQTEMFRTNGAKWRIRYKPRGAGLFQVAVYDEQSQIQDVAVSMKGGEMVSGHKTFRGRGLRYLAITGVDASWRVAVEQRLSVIEEWQLVQIMREPQPELFKVGSWTGEETEAEYEVTIPRGSWKIVHSNTGGGFLQVLVRDDDGVAAVAANTTEAGEDVSWVHRAGKFTMAVKADNTSWKVDVLGEQ